MKTASHKPFPYRLAAIDIDGTLLGPDSRMSVENAQAVARLLERGVRVVLASGRDHANVIHFHKELGLEGPIISCQGAQVRDVEADKIIRLVCMPADVAAKVVAEGHSRGMTIVYYRGDGICVAERNSHTDLYQSRGGDPLIEISSLDELTGHTPLKIIWLSTAEIVASIFPEIHARYRDSAETVITSPEYLEFMAHGINKATGLAIVAEHYGISPAEVLTFGDGNNDVPMLEWAGCGVAMSVSTPDARAAANMVVPPGDPATSLARGIDAILAAN